MANEGGFPRDDSRNKNLGWLTLQNFIQIIILIIALTVSYTKVADTELETQAKIAELQNQTGNEINAMKVQINYEFDWLEKISAHLQIEPPPREGDIGP